MDESKRGPKFRDVPPGYKYCPGCKTEKPIFGNFGKCRRKRSGVDWHCLKCKSIMNKKYRDRRKELASFRAY